MRHEWTPSLHPRGHGGEFARKGGAAQKLAKAGKAPASGREFRSFSGHLPTDTGSDIDHPTLSASERTAVYDYTGSGYSTLNQYVQAGDKIPDWITDTDYRKQIVDNAAALRSAINRSVVRRPVTARRRIPAHVADTAFGAPGSRVGATFTETRFASTTLGPDVSTGEFGPVLLRYQLRPGSKGLDVNQVGNGKASEQELILGPGQRYKVTGDRLVAGQREISLETT